MKVFVVLFFLIGGAYSVSCDEYKQSWDAGGCCSASLTDGCREIKEAWDAKNCCSRNSIVIQGYNPEEIVQNSGMYTDAGAKCYDNDGNDISSAVQVSGQVVDSSDACGTTFEIHYNCYAVTAQATRTVTVTCP